MKKTNTHIYLDKYFSVLISYGFVWSRVSYSNQVCDIGAKTEKYINGAELRVQKYAHKYNLFFTKVHRHLCGEKVFFLTKGPGTTIHPYVKNTHTQKSSIKEK